MNTYLNNLNEREKWMVLGATICVFFYIYYFLLYSPLHSAIEQKSELVNENKATLVWMNQIKNKAHATSTKQSIGNNQLLTLLATKLKANQNLKSPYQLQQTGSGDIQLNFEQVSFNEFLKWLININENYTIIIKQFSANKTPTPGITQLMIIISATS